MKAAFERVVLKAIPPFVLNSTKIYMYDIVHIVKNE